jgi:hypothetical protein
VPLIKWQPPLVVDLICEHSNLEVVKVELLWDWLVQINLLISGQ